VAQWRFGFATVGKIGLVAFAAMAITDKTIQPIP